MKSAVLVLGVLFIASACSEAPMRERARRTSCNSNLKQMGTAFSLYAADNNEESPTNITDLTRYVGGDSNVRLLFCPSRVRNLPKPAPTLLSSLKAFPAYQSYDYLSVTSAIPGGTVGATLAPVLCDKPDNHCDGRGDYGVNILFADGHVSWWPDTIEKYAKTNNLVITIRTDWVQ